MSRASTCSYHRLNPNRVFIPIAAKKTFSIDRENYPASDVSSLDEETSDAIAAVGNKHDPPLWWLRAQSSLPSETVLVQPPLPSQRVQPQSPLSRGVVNAVSSEGCTLRHSEARGRDNCDVPHAPPTSATSAHTPSSTSAAHATSTTSAPVLSAPSVSTAALKTQMTMHDELETRQLATQNDPEEGLHTSQTEPTDQGQEGVFDDKKSEYGSDGGISESGWTTASGGMAFSLSTPDGKLFGQPILKPNGNPVISSIPVQMRPAIKSPKALTNNRPSPVNNSMDELKKEISSAQGIANNQVEEAKVVEKKVGPPPQSVKMPDPSAKPSPKVSAAEKQRTYCELYNAQIETIFAGISSKYPQPMSTRAAKEARQVELDTKRAKQVVRIPPPRPDEAGAKHQVPASIDKKAPVGRDNQQEQRQFSDDSEIPPNWEACEPDPSTRPNSTNGWINWKPKPKTGPASARSGHMTMSEYQAAIAYKPQGVDRNYEAAKARAAAKRFSGPEYQYYNQQSHKKRRPKSSPRKAEPQKSTLPPMFPDILPWREVVPQPPNPTGKKMPKLDFCGEPIQKGRGFDGNIKHWGVPTKNQDHVPFIEINAIASEYTTDCDKDTNDPTRKSVRRFPPPKPCSVGNYSTYSEIEANHRKEKATLRLKKKQEKIEALEQPGSLPRLFESYFEKNGFTLRERITTFLRSLNPDFPDLPENPDESYDTEPAVPCIKRMQPRDDSEEIIINCVEDELKETRREPHREPIRGRADMEWYRTHDGCWSQRFPLPKKALSPLPPNESANDW